MTRDCLKRGLAMSTRSPMHGTATRGSSSIRDLFVRLRRVMSLTSISPRSRCKPTRKRTRPFRSRNRSPTTLQFVRDHDTQRQSGLDSKIEGRACMARGHICICMSNPGLNHMLIQSKRRRSRLSVPGHAPQFQRKSRQGRVLPVGWRARAPDAQEQAASSKGATSWNAFFNLYGGVFEGSSWVPERRVLSKFGLCNCIPKARHEPM